jgi:hypothetical protein
MTFLEYGALLRFARSRRWAPPGVKGVSFQSPFEIPAFFRDDWASSWRLRGGRFAPYFAKL